MSSGWSRGERLSLAWEGPRRCGGGARRGPVDQVATTLVQTHAPRPRWVTQLASDSGPFVPSAWLKRQRIHRLLCSVFLRLCHPGLADPVGLRTAPPHLARGSHTQSPSPCPGQPGPGAGSEDTPTPRSARKQFPSATPRPPASPAAPQTAGRSAGPVSPPPTAPCFPTGPGGLAPSSCELCVEGRVFGGASPTRWPRRIRIRVVTEPPGRPLPCPSVAPGGRARGRGRGSQAPLGDRFPLRAGDSSGAWGWLACPDAARAEGPAVSAEPPTPPRGHGAIQARARPLRATPSVFGPNAVAAGAGEPARPPLGVGPSSPVLRALACWALGGAQSRLLGGTSSTPSSHPETLSPPPGRGDADRLLADPAGSGHLQRV